MARYNSGVKLELADTQDADAHLARTATMEGSRAPKRPSSVALQADQRLGHFKIERKLGEGGMGEVYLATDLALDRPVAIKVLPQKAASDPGRRDRMIREARAQARVMHPNVGHIYFIGEEEGRLYFAMEYVVGKTLGELLADGPMTPDTAIEYIRAAALGLREAQGNGFTHRDVKPSNLMVDAHGVLKVLDFGLAAGGDIDAANDGPVAQTNVAGTPLYMAPEQARGDAIDFRADIYALGATLYQLVTGKPPFVADSAAELRSLHESAPRPAVVRRGLAKSDIQPIDALCKRMMAHDVNKRFANYDELILALEMASQTHTRAAGFLVRSFAGFIDLVILAVVFGIAHKIAFSGTVPNLYDFSTNVIFVGYFAFCQVYYGRTAGAALLELEVVDVETSKRPTWKPALLRATWLFVPPLVLDSVVSYFALPQPIRSGLKIVIALWVVCAFAEMIHAAWRSPGKRTWWDRRSRTMVRYRMKPTARS